MSTSTGQSSPPRTRRLYWVRQTLVHLVPIILVLRVSFEVMFRNDWFIRNPYLEPGRTATLFAFVPAGIRAEVDGYPLVPTGQVVALWAVVGAAVVFVDHLFVGVFGFTQGMTLTAMEIVRWAEAALAFAEMHAVPAAALVLSGAGPYRLRTTRTARESMGPAEHGG